MPKILSPVCDRIFFAGIKHKKYKISSTKQKTVAFRSQYKSHYLDANIEPPPGAKENVGKVPYEWLLSVTGMKEAVSKLGFVPL